MARESNPFVCELHTLTRAALDHAPLEEAVHALLARARMLLRADAAAVLLLANTTHHLVVFCADGCPNGLVPGSRLPLGRELVDRVLLEVGPGGRGLSEAPLTGAGVRSLLRVPLLVAGRATGLVEVARAAPEHFEEEDLRLLRRVAPHLSLAIDHGRLQHACRQAGDRASRAERRCAFLLEAGEVLHAARDVVAGFASLGHRAVLGFADWCTIDLQIEREVLVRAAMAHRDPVALALAREMVARYPIDLQAADYPAQVLRTGRRQFVPTVSDDTWPHIAHDKEHLRMLLALDLQSMIIVPMTVGRRVFGAISFGRTSGGVRYTETDVATADQVARYAALALATARPNGEICDPAGNGPRPVLRGECREKGPRNLSACRGEQQ